MTTAIDIYENRFRDPEFVAVWERFQVAVANWGKIARRVPFKCFTEERNYYNPDPELMPEEAKAAASEYVESRKVYKLKIADYIRRIDEEQK